MVASEDHLLVAVIDDTIHTDTPHGRAIRRIIEGLKEYGIHVADVASPADARAAYTNFPSVSCVLINWNLGGNTKKKQTDTAKLIHQIRTISEDLPIFLMAEPTSEAPAALTVDLIREINAYG